MVRLCLLFAACGCWDAASSHARRRSVQPSMAGAAGGPRPRTACVDACGDESCRGAAACDCARGFGVVPAWLGCRLTQPWRGACGIDRVKVRRWTVAGWCTSQTKGASVRLERCCGLQGHVAAGGCPRGLRGARFKGAAATPRVAAKKQPAEPFTRVPLCGLMLMCRTALTEQKGDATIGD